MSNMARKHFQALASVLFFLLVAIVFSTRAFNLQPGNNNRSLVAIENISMHECKDCHQKLDDQTATLYSKSVHAKSAFGCDACHGGNPNATDKQTAHRFKFAGNPSDPQKLAMCGQCHTAQLATFKTSLHHPERVAASRMTCVECHGAHTVGSLSRDFSFALYCTNCHGLEYLPALPQEFQKMLALVDEQRALLEKLATAGRKPSGELLALRREIRRTVAEIVHATNLSGGLEKLPLILKRGEEFKAMAEREQK
jgi:cytochrome c3-like protein